jgi:hypothetical protein
MFPAPVVTIAEPKKIRINRSSNLPLMATWTRGDVRGLSKTALEISSDQVTILTTPASIAIYLDEVVTDQRALMPVHTYAWPVERQIESKDVIERQDSQFEGSGLWLTIPV